MRTPIKPKTTAEIVNDLAGALGLFHDDEGEALSLEGHAAIGNALARLVEVEPNNPELDGWRNHIRQCDWQAGCPTGR